jgi:hypothetical protein
MMTTKREDFKLFELREKTDRQLAEYINSRLDSGITFARLVTDPETRTRWASTDLFLERARASFEEACRLLPWIPERDRRRALHSKVDQLGRLLSEVSRPGADSCLRAAC